MTAVSIPKIPNIIPHLPLLSPLDKAEEPKSIAVNPNGIPKIIKEITPRMMLKVPVNPFFSAVKTDRGAVRFLPQKGQLFHSSSKNLPH